MRTKPTRDVDKSSLNQVIGFGCICERKDFQPVGGPSYILEEMDLSKFVRKLMNYKVDLPGEYNVLLLSMFLIFLHLMQAKIRGRILLRRGGMMRTKVGLVLKILCKFQMGQLQDQEPRRSRKQ